MGIKSGIGLDKIPKEHTQPYKKKVIKQKVIELSNMIQHTNHMIQEHRLIDEQPNGSHTNNMAIKISKFKYPSEG